MVDEQMDLIDYSIVIPIFNEEENIRPLTERLVSVMKATDSTYEIVFIDNGSIDKSPIILGDLLNEFGNLKVITLSRNFGYDGGISSGFEYAKGSRIIIMDGDQQDPPEEIPRFISKAKEGYDIVYGIRKKRNKGFLLNLQMKFFYRIWKQVVTINVPKDAGNFGIISREVMDIIKDMPERNKFIRGLRAWTGYPSVGIEYKRDRRSLGKTKFSFVNYLNHAVNGITSFSTAPLRMFSYLGFIGLSCCFLFGLYIFITRIISILGYNIIDYGDISGTATIILLILAVLSINLFGLGIIGEYIGRILEEVKKRPNYIVKKVRNSSKDFDMTKSEKTLNL